MTRTKTFELAKELCSRYGLTVYVHTDPTTSFNLRFGSPIESIGQEDCKTIAHYAFANGYPELTLVQVKSGRKRA